MSTLHYRRVRGDMIETYKILSGKYDSNVVPTLKTSGIQTTRGNDLRIFKTRFRYDLRKFYFTNRVVDAWNSLPNWIVMANSTNTFKRRLDIYWQPGRTKRLSTIFMHSYKEPEVAVKCLDIIKYHIGYVKV